MQNENRLSDKIIKETLVNSVRQIVDETISKRLEPVIKVLGKSRFYNISEFEAFEMLNVSLSTFNYYKNVGLLNGIYSEMGMENHQKYKLSEVLALIQN